MANIVKSHVVIAYSKKEKMTLLVRAGYGNRYRWLATRITPSYERFVRK